MNLKRVYRGSDDPVISKRPRDRTRRSQKVEALYLEANSRDWVLA